MVDQPPDPEVYVAKRLPSNYAAEGTCAPSQHTGTAGHDIDRVAPAFPRAGESVPVSPEDPGRIRIFR
jgi:hypothetical protein